MAGTEILKSLFDEKKIRLLQALITESGEQTLQEISKKSKVPIATAFRQMKEFTDLGICKRRKVKHLTLYTLGNSEEALYLSNLLYERPKPIERFLELIAPMQNIDTILLHGEASDSRANIVLLGDNIERERINQAVATLKEELNYTLSHLILDQEQFIMLEQMGQFSGTRTILYEK